MDSDPTPDTPDRIQVGQRVECRLEGPFKGQNGRVEDIFAGQAKVRLPTATIMESLDAFERVGAA
ncbi:hypothetical protein EXE44_04835 [Halorubrum sp. SS7]|uniref:hypothetical protein n=1 Tax=unclassified Halorubrum TaxID=2642239 RepID=UPI0010F4E07C|nr:MULTISPECIES: hypothetical protein [unclassified Halorubrum]TKX58872.1 hypothetical protein EXE44_04835 [Halorubrum sp. SS7]TKX64498.1 hypothetical protein EXE45_16510 [Halorubrum sp. SP9]